MTDTLEDYVVLLGKLVTMASIFREEHEKLVRSGLLNFDEMELAETVNWRIEQLSLAISDSIREVSQRIPGDITEIIKDKIKE